MTQASRGFLRDHAFLVAAVSLPLVVVGFFLLSSIVPRWLVPPPAYDLLLRVDRYDPATPRVVADFRVRDGKVEATIRPAPANTYPQRSSLFLFDHTTMTVREVPLDLPAAMAESDPPRTVIVEPLAGRRVVDQARAPDGYQFENRSQRGPGFVGELFGMRRYDLNAAIVNKGRVIPITLPVPYQYQSPVAAVGWLVD